MYLVSKLGHSSLLRAGVNTIVGRSFLQGEKRKSTLCLY